MLQEWERREHRVVKEELREREIRGTKGNRKGEGREGVEMLVTKMSKVMVVEMVMDMVKVMLVSVLVMKVIRVMVEVGVRVTMRMNRKEVVTSL